MDQKQQLEYFRNHLMSHVRDEMRTRGESNVNLLQFTDRLFAMMVEFMEIREKGIDSFRSLHSVNANGARMCNEPHFAQNQSSAQSHDWGKVPKDYNNPCKMCGKYFCSKECYDSYKFITN